jgi:hypothetical protein
MKSIKYLLIAITAIIFAFPSCSNEDDVRLNDMRYVRLDNTSVYLRVGEKMKVTASVDSIEGSNYNLVWSIMDNSIATIESYGSTGVITGVAPGSTIVKVEDSEHKLEYYGDLTVSDDQIPTRILSIGSGTANDATISFFHDIASGAGISLINGSIYFEGASFEDHINNFNSSAAVYDYNLTTLTGSIETSSDVTLKSIVESQNWDYIVFEESTDKAGLNDGYETSLPLLMNAISEVATNPDVKFVLHQPWAYAKNSTEAGFANYNRDQTTMYDAITSAVSTAANSNGISMVIPSGTAIQNARTSYLGEDVLMGDIKLNTNIGRYVTACTWYDAFFGDLTTSYAPASMINYDNRLAKEAAQKAISNQNSVTTLTDFVYAPVKIYIDFGPVLSEEPFNNYSYPTDPMVENLKDDRGNETTMCIAKKQGFSGILDRGLTNTLGMPTTASQDMFFADGKYIPLSILTLSGLNVGEKYTFNFYGNINDNGTQTEYHVVGSNEGTDYLDNDYNGDKVASVNGILPNSDGTIDVEISPGPNNVQFALFCGINVMIIMPEG